MSEIQISMVKRDRGGWKAESVIEFQGAKKLSIATWRSSINGEVISNASVNEYGDTGTVTHVFGSRSSGDYSEYVIVKRGVRATEKAILEQQKQALLAVPQILERAKEHYAKAKAHALMLQAGLPAVQRIGQELGGAA